MSLGDLLYNEAMASMYNEKYINVYYETPNDKRTTYLKINFNSDPSNS